MKKLFTAKKPTYKSYSEKETRYNDQCFVLTDVRVYYPEEKNHENFSGMFSIFHKYHKESRAISISNHIIVIGLQSFFRKGNYKISKTANKGLAKKGPTILT
jgi:hypothetical protein